MGKTETGLCGFKIILIEVMAERRGTLAALAKMGLASTPPSIGLVAASCAEWQYLYEGWVGCYYV